METTSSTHTWRIPWTEEPGGLQSMELQRVGYERATEQQIHVSILFQILFSYRLLQSIE